MNITTTHYHKIINFYSKNSNVWLEIHSEYRFKAPINYKVKSIIGRICKKSGITLNIIIDMNRKA